MSYFTIDSYSFGVQEKTAKNIIQSFYSPIQYCFYVPFRNIAQPDYFWISIAFGFYPRCL